MFMKKFLMLFIILILVCNFAPARCQKSIAHYEAVAARLIAEAVAEGPDAYQKLWITNENNGAIGASSCVAEKGDPRGAALIMIRVANVMINYGDITPDSANYPKAGNYYQWGLQALDRALKHINEFGRTNPLAASNMVIQVCWVFRNANPKDKSQAENYDARIRLYMATGNKNGARSHANKIKDVNTRRMQFNRIETQKRAMGF